MAIAQELQDSSSPKKIWIDVGAHLGESTLALARADPTIRVYAFEPNVKLAARLTGLLSNFIVIPMAVGRQNGFCEFHLNSYDGASSMLPFDPQGLSDWKGTVSLEVVQTITVPVIRLDTFMEQTGVKEVDFLKIDAQGADFEVVSSAGGRLADIRRVRLEVQVMSRPLYSGGSRKDMVIDYMTRKGFRLLHIDKQCQGQEENLTFLGSASAGDEAESAG